YPWVFCAFDCCAAISSNVFGWGPAGLTWASDDLDSCALMAASLSSWQPAEMSARPLRRREPTRKAYDFMLKLQVKKRKAGGDPNAGPSSAPDNHRQGTDSATG